MKVTIEEYETHTFLWFTAENSQDAAKLSRIAITTKKEPAKITTFFGRDLEINTEMIFEKKTNYNPHVGG